VSGCLLRHIFCSAFTKADSVCVLLLGYYSTGGRLTFVPAMHFIICECHCDLLPEQLLLSSAADLTRSRAHRTDLHVRAICARRARDDARSLLQLSDTYENCRRQPFYYVCCTCCKQKKAKLILLNAFDLCDESYRNKTKCVFVNLFAKFSHLSHCWQILSNYLLLIQTKNSGV
jgi:hypothetical protein